MALAGDFLWEESSFQFKELKTPIYGIVAHVELVDRNFGATADNAYPEIFAYLQENQLQKYMRLDDTSIYNYPDCPRKPGKVFVEPGLLIREDADIAAIKRVLADTTKNPKSDPDQENNEGLKFRLFEAKPNVEWAVYRLRGAYSQISLAMDNTFKQLPSFGRRVALEHGACFDYYLNSCTNTEVEDLITDLYIPVEKVNSPQSHQQQ